jgi:hypothetical protein
VPSPKPDAAPVTMKTLPLMSMRVSRIELVALRLRKRQLCGMMAALGWHLGQSLVIDYFVGLVA